MINSFADSGTEDLFHGRITAKSRRIPNDIRRPANRRLDALNAAAELRDLRAPPSNRLEALSGSLVGSHSIRINDQWRIVFRWTNSGPADVRIVDYH